MPFAAAPSMPLGRFQMSAFVAFLLSGKVGQSYAHATSVVNLFKEPVQTCM